MSCDKLRKCNLLFVNALYLEGNEDEHWLVFFVNNELKLS